MAGSLRTQAVVLRSLKYGDSDRILHLYTRDHGRIAAIAKGSRRARSRFGGRLEPLFRLDLMLYEGRKELLTITGAQTIDGYPKLRTNAGALQLAARACQAVSKLFDGSEPHPHAYNLLCNQLSLFDTHPENASIASGLAFRLKLLVVAGLAPALTACATCGDQDHLTGFSAKAGGIVCNACEAGSFSLDQEAYEFMVRTLGVPLAQAPTTSKSAFSQVERVILEILEYHGNIRLGSLAGSY